MNDHQKNQFPGNKEEIMQELPDRQFVKLDYWFTQDKELDLENPTTFDEKINWLKLYNHRSEYTKMVDKYEVRQYIKEKIGSEYLIPLYGMWENVEEIDWEELPNQFVLKTTHDSGGVVICEDKKELDIDQTKKKLKQFLHYNYFNEGREWPYKNVKPRIVAEKYMEGRKEQSFKDYKIFCFNGQVKMTLVLTDLQHEENVTQKFYNRDWELMPLKESDSPHSDEAIERPYNYQEMIKVAETLAEDIPFVRVDLYEINQKVYFGELTFFPNKGQNTFEPEKYNEILGSWLKLPKEKVIG